VQQNLMRIRAVPFSNLNERLYRIVRQTARELDKKAELAYRGLRGRARPQRCWSASARRSSTCCARPGARPRDSRARAAAGKPDTGRISINLLRRANEIALVLSDDGTGLDLEKLARRASRGGSCRLKASRPRRSSAQLIFASGFSTRTW